jgi:hypothetical protein
MIRMTVFSAQELLKRHSIDFVESRKGKYTTDCPNCSGNYLNVEIKRDGVVWFCQSCQQGAGEKFEQAKPTGELGPIKAVYDYTDETGKLLFQVLRFEPINGAKEFRQRTGPDQEKWSIKGVRIVPFNLPAVLEAIANEQTVFVCEGEKDVLTLQRLGIVATCNPMGAQKWRREFNELLRGGDMVIAIDNDDPGREHGQLVAQNLLPVAKRVRLLDLAKHWPTIEVSDDVTDWIEQGGSPEALWSIVEQLPTLDEIKLNGSGNGHDEAKVNATPALRLYLPSVYIFPEATGIPGREWIHGGHYIRGAATATVAPGGTGKTTLSLYEAMIMAGEGYRVWYISGEDPRVEIDRRLAAHVQWHKSDLLRIQGNLFIDDRESYPIKLTKAARGASVVFDDQWIDLFAAGIRRNRLDVVTIDPFITFHTVPENDNTAMDMIIKRVSQVCIAERCCVEFSHHVRKPAQAQAEITVDDARGGGAIVNAVRSCRVINRMSTELAQQARVDLDKRSMYLRLDPGKRNMAPAESASWWRLVSVKIANGVDSVQAIERWEFPKLFGEVSVADAEAIREIVRKGESRADPRSPHWLGHDLAKRFKRDVNSKGDRIWMNAVIGTWLANGWFAKEQKFDPDLRKPRTFYVLSSGPADQTAADADSNIPPMTNTKRI